MSETYWPWIFFLSAIIATYVWRFTAVLISNRIKSNHPFFEWVTCLSYGIIGSLVAITVLFPTGLLLFVPLWQRLFAISIAFLGFYLLGKRLWIGILFGEASLIFILWFSETKIFE